MVISVPKVAIDLECTLSALAVDSALLSPFAFCWLTEIIPITVTGILVGEVGAEEDWNDSRSTVSEFSLECELELVNSGSIVKKLWRKW